MMRQFILLWMLLYPVTSLSYQDIIPYPRSLHIVTLGDSVMSGYGLGHDQSFTQMLGRYLRIAGYHHIQMMDMTGEHDTALDIGQKIPQVMQYQPHLIIIAFGRNDMLQKRRLTQIYEQLEYILKTLTEQKVKVILAGMPDSLITEKPYKEKMPQIYKYLAYKYRTYFYPNFLEDVERRSTLLQGDEIHPNLMGTEVIVQRMRPLIQSILDTIPDPKE